MSACGVVALAALAVVCVGCGGSSPGSPPAPAPSGPSLVQVDRTAAGVGGNGEALGIRFSADGRYAVFSSTATNFGETVPSATSQIYRKDLQTGTLLLVSRAWDTAGRPIGNSSSLDPAISDDGNVIAFTSLATNLVGTDSLAHYDIFVVNVSAATVTRISAAFMGLAPNGSSWHPDVSGDGSTIVYASAATNLVAGDTNGTQDVFAFRRSGTGAGTIRRLSVTNLGEEKVGDSEFPRVNRDGTFVVFTSRARLHGSDSNVYADIYRANVDWATPAAPQIWRVSVGATVDNPDNHSMSPSVSSDGMLTAYASSASNLIATGLDGPRNIFVYDRTWLSTALVSMPDSASEAGNGTSHSTGISGDGRYVVFASSATNLVASDTNGTWDIFLHDRAMRRTRRVSLGAVGQQNDGESLSPSISRDGSAIGFQAKSTILPGGSASDYHVYRILNPPSGSG